MPAFKRRLIAATALLLCAAAPLPEAHSVDLAGRDLTIKPGDDFYAYANGGWMAVTDIPPDASSWGRVAEMRDRTRKQVADLLEHAARREAMETAEARKVGDFYASFLDETTVETLGLKPVLPGIRAIAEIKTKAQLTTAIGKTLRADTDALNNTVFYTEHLFGLWVAPDMNVPSRNTAYLMQGGLGLPDREYYLSDSEKMAGLRAAYLKHIAAVFALAGIANGDAKAQSILDLETAIAKVHASRADNNEVRKGNNPWTRADFAVKAPGLDWNAFFNAAGLGKQKNFIVWQPGAFAGMAALLDSVPLSTWKDYLTFHYINHNAPYLTKAFTDERFAFYGTTLSGTETQSARWKRAMDVANTAMPDAIGRLYAAMYFPPAAKVRLQRMVDNIKAAFSRRIDALDWMSPATRAKAKEKLAVLYVGIGYPEKWHSYSGLVVRRGDLFGNVARAESWDMQRDLVKLRAPVDHTEWSMSPQTVNAVNLPLQNALNFPAAYLQPPFYDAYADDAFNYGAIGATIGHEISHSFDDQGSLFDARGALANWWTQEDLAHFEASSDALAKQYDAYCPFADLCLNGRQTLSENIADVAGVSASFDAWKALHQDGPAQGSITQAQEFFLNYAQRSRTKARENTLRQQILTDGHSPGMYRAQAVRNVDAWYTAFGVQLGDKLYLAPAARVKVW